MRHTFLHGTFFRGAGILLASLLCASVSFATFGPGAIYRPGGLQWYVRGAHNFQQDEYCVIWADAGAGDQIRGFRLTAEGQRHPTDPNVRVIDAGPGIAPAIAYNPNSNEYLAIWSDGSRDVGDIRARFLDGNCSPKTAEFSIFNGAGTQHYPELAYNSENNVYMVTWSRLGISTGARVAMQVVSGNSAVPTLLLPQPVQLEATPNALIPHSATVAWNAFTNKFFVAWTMFRRVGGNEKSYIRGWIFNGDGTSAFGPFTMVDFSTDNKLPRIAANSRNGEFLVTFDEGVGISLNVWGMIYNSNGTLLRGPFPIANNLNIPDWRSHAAYNELANTYFVTWNTGRGCGGSGPCDDILGRTIAPDGTFGPVIGVADGPSTTDPGVKLESHGVDDGFGSWAALISSSRQADFFELYQISSTGINGALVEFTPTEPPSLAPPSFDGDQTADIAVWRGGDGAWAILRSDGGGTINLSLGQPGDIPVPGDYDGDGIADAAVYRPGSPSVWLIRQSSNGAIRNVAWGSMGAIAVPADYDGDGKTDIAVFRWATPAVWNILQSSTLTARSVQWGNEGSFPVPGDYDGDGQADIAVYRWANPAFWSILESSTLTSRIVNWGSVGSYPAPADYDGDGQTDVAVYLPGDPYLWSIRESSTTNRRDVFWGSTGAEVVPADYDGDGKADVAVYRRGMPSLWSIRQSSSMNTRSVEWGSISGTPVSSAMWWLQIFR